MRECESKMARFHALVDYKTQLDRHESILDKVINAKGRTLSEYDSLKEQMPKIESHIEEIKDKLHVY